MAKTFFPVLSPDRARLNWYEVKAGGKIVPTQPPAGLKFPAVAQFRVIELPGGKFAGLKLATDGSVSPMEGEDLGQRIIKAIRTPFWLRYRAGKLGDMDATIHDIVYFSFQCSTCGRYYRPIDGLSGQSWEMVCQNCQPTATLPNW